MSNFIHYTRCPVCGSPAINNSLSARDHTASGEIFAIAECSDCSLRFTQDVPDESSIQAYYRSEDYISHTNTAKGLINRVYLLVRNSTIRSKRRLISRVTGLKKGDLLDVGSGTGAFLHEMNKHGWGTTGLEPDADAKKMAKQLYDLELGQVTDLYQLPGNSFDVITLWHVLEHVHDLGGYIQQLKKVLKENGRLFIAVPNYTSGEAAIYKEWWAAYDVPRHLYHFSPQAMKILMENNGLKLVQYKPMWYDSFYISLLSNKYKTGRPGFIVSLWNGLRSNMRAFGDAKKCSSVIYIISR